MDSLTAIDWCGFRTKSHPADVMDSLHSCFSSPHYLRFEGTGKGWNGYKETRRIEYLRKSVGLVAFGGNNGWCQVNLSGDCMEHITGDVSEVLSQLVEDLDGQYKRVDIALTTHDGSVSLETVKRAYDSNGFRIRGKYPALRAITSTNESDGETYYIGERESPKYVRTYEKGLQLAKDFSLRLNAHMGVSFPVDSMMIEGVPVHDIFRVELELKPNPELFPADILMNRDEYFAGAYPYLAELVSARPGTFKLTAQRKAVLTADKAAMECRRQYGDVLYTLLMLHEGDITAVWDKIVGTKHSKSLLEAGVLFALPEYQ